MKSTCTVVRTGGGHALTACTTSGITRTLCTLSKQSHRRFSGRFKYFPRLELGQHRPHLCHLYLHLHNRRLECFDSVLNVRHPSRLRIFWWKQQSMLIRHGPRKISTTTSRIAGWHAPTAPTTCELRLARCARCRSIRIGRSRDGGNIFGRWDPTSLDYTRLPPTIPPSPQSPVLLRQHTRHPPPGGGGKVGGSGVIKVGQVPASENSRTASRNCPFQCSALHSSRSIRTGRSQNGPSISRR